MKLLFDENLSSRLVRRLSASYPGSDHVDAVGLHGATDADIWAFGRERGYMIVSKDNDFRQRSFLEGAPPKVVWLEVGNAGTRTIEELLRRERANLLTFESDEQSALLIVSLVARVV